MENAMKIVFCNEKGDYRLPLLQKNKIVEFRYNAVTYLLGKGNICGWRSRSRFMAMVIINSITLGD